jgi:hypothetical protein
MCGSFNEDLPTLVMTLISAKCNAVAKAPAIRRGPATGFAGISRTSGCLIETVFSVLLSFIRLLAQVLQELGDVWRRPSTLAGRQL